MKVNINPFRDTRERTFSRFSLLCEVEELFYPAIARMRLLCLGKLLRFSKIEEVHDWPNSFSLVCYTVRCSIINCSENHQGGASQNFYSWTIDHIILSVSDLHSNDVSNTGRTHLY